MNLPPFLQRLFLLPRPRSAAISLSSGPWGDNPWGDSSKKPTPPKNSNPGKPTPPPLPPEADPFQRFREHYDRAKHSWNGNSGGNGGAGRPKFSPEHMALALLAGALLVWAASGFYAVDAREEGVVLRFGEYVRTATPGLNYHLPEPIEKVVTLRVQDRYKEEIGYRSSNDSARRSLRGNGEPEAPKEILMLTGDENLVAVTLEVQWQISNSQKFLFHVFDPKQTVRNAAESALREIVGTTPINDILSEGRAVVQLETKQLLQHMLDSYDSGIEISEINMKAVPPSQVVDAFRDVQAAKINKEEMINKAITYRNEVVPKAQGEAERFISVYKQYAQAKDVTRTRMYLETMEQILRGMDKVILDGKNAPLTYLPLPSLAPSNSAHSKPKEPANASR